jgi:hypothetical protein
MIRCCLFGTQIGLTPKIPSLFLPISTSKMLVYSKKSPKNLFFYKNVETFNPRKIMIYQFYYKNLVKKLLKILTVVACPKYLQPTLGFVEF